MTAFETLTDVPSTIELAASPPAIEAALDDFERATATPAWPNIDKAALIADLRASAANPYLIDQYSTPLCGPAAVVFDLARRDPLRYIALCRQLFEQGAIDLDGLQVRPSAACLRSAPKPGVTPADWVMLAGLRDAENILWPVTGHSPSVAGITTPNEMVQWCKRLHRLPKATFTSTVVYGEFDAMRTCQKALDAGGVAYLLVDSNLVRGSKPKVYYPNHWVAFLGGLQIRNGVWWKIDSGSIRFDCYSWGQKLALSKGEGTFEDGMWGAVTATR